jgi:hypothetical protein
MSTIETLLIIETEYIYSTVVDAIQGLSHRHPTHSLMIFDVCFRPVYCSLACTVVKLKLIYINLNLNPIKFGK